MRADDTRILDNPFAAGKIANHTAGLSFDDYLKIDVVRAVVEWHVFTIGEAARQLSRDFRDRHSAVPWHKILGARNILAHEYGKIDDEIMWSIATIHVPELAAYLTPFGPHEVEE